MNEKYPSDSQIPMDERWDFRILMKDAEKPEISESLQQLGKKITQTKHPLKWILTEPPASLTFFVITCCRDNIENYKSKPSYDFWKFMRAPGTEILLTEAAHRGYLPAMSILASHYANDERDQEAEYWQKVGVSHLNPTSIMLWGLNLMIQGSLNNDDLKCNKGKRLIVLSHLLGEDKAQTISGFEKIRNSKRFDSYDEDDILKTIWEIEESNEASILEFIEDLQASWPDQVEANVMIESIRKINAKLDNPNVTIMELSMLLPIRNSLVDELKLQLSTNTEFIESFEKAELVFRYQRIGRGTNFVTDTLFPMIFGK